MRIPMPPPWVLLSLVLGFSQHIQDFKDIAGLGWSLVRGRGDAGCSLCDKLVNVMLKSVELDDLAEGGGINCQSMCFKFGKCVDTCEKITQAMTNSTGFPCVAAGICPAVDEFGEVSCKFSYKTMGCDPPTACVYKFPKCELKDSYKKWKQMSRLLTDNLDEMNNALRTRKKCSEKGAHPLYCIREATGLGAFAEWSSIALTIVGGALFSVHAIETPGGDDDRQWLTFWIIMMGVFYLERVTDVLLSQMPRYCKLYVPSAPHLSFSCCTSLIFFVRDYLLLRAPYAHLTRQQTVRNEYERSELTALRCSSLCVLVCRLQMR